MSKELSILRHCVAEGEEQGESWELSVGLSTSIPGPSSVQIASCFDSMKIHCDQTSFRPPPARGADSPDTELIVGTSDKVEVTLGQRDKVAQLSCSCLFPRSEEIIPWIASTPGDRNATRFSVMERSTKPTALLGLSRQ